MLNILPLFLLLPLFFYKLSQSSLISWDEAWYAEISRNILKTGDFFNLVWNGTPFSDKPPGGFWLEALSFKFLGISEFSARFPSALAGFLCLIVVYLLGAKLFSKLTGYLSVIGLISAYWFLYRSRFGDLDTLLTLFYLLSVYLAILVTENKKYLYLLCISLAFLPMIKGVVFVFSIIPTLVVIFWGNKILKIKDYLIILFSNFGLFGIWFLFQYLKSPALALYHFQHSFRDSSIKSSILNNFLIFKEYLHNGIGKWFWPGVLGAILSVVTKDKRIFPILLFPVIYSVQFLFSANLEIWHLIPLYPFMILLFFGSMYLIGARIIRLRFFLNILIVIFTFYVAYIQIVRMWNEFINIPAFITDDAILSKEAGKYEIPFYIDSSFEPVAVFYSEKNVKWVNSFGLPKLFSEKSPFVLIVKQSMLDNLKIDKKDYKIIKTDRDKLLIKYL